MSTIPEIGDRVQCYHYTPQNPHPQEINLWLKNPWAWMPAPDLNKLRCWGDWPIVVLRRARNNGKVWLVVTCEHFDEPLRSQGVRVPLTHIELVQKGYGLPPLNIAPVAVGERVEMRSAEYQQGALL